MNFCIECDKAFELTNNLDYCETCRIILGIKPGEFQENETVREPEIVEKIRERFVAHGYKTLGSY